jgi:hypothetical protein
MLSIYDQIMDELNSREAYMHEVYAPYYICSYAIHAFNLMNQKREIYFIGKQLQNMRLHLLFISPSGYMKTYYGDVMGRDPSGIFHKTEVSMASEQTLTEAGFVGTIASVNGLAINNPGSAELNKDGILFIDEFKGITEALKNQMNSQMETQLLAALDHGHVNKRLGSGSISYRTFLTLWTGVQPGSYDLSSGLGRRLCVMIFVPTKGDNDAIMDTMHRTQNMRPNMDDMNLLWDNINEVVHKMNQIERIELDDSILKFYHQQDMYSFETSYFNRIIIGYHLMKYGPSKVMHMDLHDKDLVKLLELQKKWRGDVYAGLDYLQIRKILVMHNKQCERQQIAKECAMIGWNAKMVYEKLGEMQKFGIIKVKGSMVNLNE